jgi:hypothetical protein
VRVARANSLEAPAHVACLVSVEGSSQPLTHAHTCTHTRTHTHARTHTRTATVGGAGEGGGHCHTHTCTHTERERETFVTGPTARATWITALACAKAHTTAIVSEVGKHPWILSSFAAGDQPYALVREDIHGLGHTHTHTHTHALRL